MAKKPTAAAPKPQKTADDGAFEQVNLAKFLSKKATYSQFSFWIVGHTPIICHAWSEKARWQMLQKQAKSIQPGKEARKPELEFKESLYELADGTQGFPAMAFKNAIVSVAHKDKGVPRSVVQGALFVNALWCRTRPALAGAACTMPLLRLWGSEPYMREDMVRIGSGARKTANLAYRGSIDTWAVQIRGKFNSSVLNEDILAALVDEAGIAVGVGDWRTEKKGMFGSFHMADDAEGEAWSAFANGKGPLPSLAGTPWEFEYLEAA